MLVQSISLIKEDKYKHKRSKSSQGQGSNQKQRSPSFCWAYIHRLTCSHSLECSNQEASQDCDVEVLQSK
jgi:hypothetical protein